MDRRNALTLVALAIATPTVAMAQRAGGDAGTMGDAERKHAQDTLAAGAVALETSKIAEKKAQHAWAKKFAQYEVAEQTTIAEVLKSMGATPGKMTEKQAAMVKKLEDAKADAGFDREYLAGQIDGHNDLLKIQETYIASGKNAAHIGMAKLARGQIKEHLDLLATIQKEIKAS